MLIAPNQNNSMKIPRRSLVRLSAASFAAAMLDRRPLAAEQIAAHRAAATR